MRKVIEEEFPGLYYLEGNHFSDHRGAISKVLSDKIIPSFSADEVYFTISHKDVLRGMHYQLPPFQQTKLIYVSRGKLLDVILDIRPDSPTYGQHVSYVLEGGDNRVICIPPGVAHGNLTLEPDTYIHYVQSGLYSPEHERGIRFDSFGMDWKIKTPILSEKDKSLPGFMP